MTSRLGINRRQIDQRPTLRRWSSPAIHGLATILTQVLARWATGMVLDVGCGAMPYRRTIEEHATGYDGLDIEPRSSAVLYVCSVTEMSPVPDAAYDTVLCSEVLEHVADPGAALAEIGRVLKPGGRLILTTPFLGRLHDEPHDYYRFTKHGLATLLSAVPLEVEATTSTGSVASFLGHQVSAVLVGATWHIPVIKWMAFAINAAFVVAPGILIDRLLGPVREKMPLGYVVVAVKR